MKKYININENNYVIATYENKQNDEQILIEIPADFEIGLFKYENKELIKDINKEKMQLKSKIVKEYQAYFQELDITYCRKIALGQATQEDYSIARNNLKLELQQKLEEV